MKKIELLNFYDDLNAIDEVFPAKLSYCIAKNKNIIKPEVEILKELLPKFELEQQRNNIMISNATKDENGNIIWVNQAKGIPQYKDPVKLNDELSKFNNENSEYLLKFKKQQEDYKTMLNENIDFAFYKISTVNLPENISVKYMELLFPFFEE